MLEYLRIRNLALIEDMELEFAPGMNVLTGETGAGKSFILKALGFLLGDRLAADMVRPGAERAQVEALFSQPEQDLILRRELLAESGRSRLYINDSLRSQESLRDLRDRLVSHTSQHAQQKLLQPAVQARLLEHGLADPTLPTQRDALLEDLRRCAKNRPAWPSVANCWRCSSRKSPRWLRSPARKSAWNRCEPRSARRNGGVRTTNGPLPCSTATKGKVCWTSLCGWKSCWTI